MASEKTKKTLKFLTKKRIVAIIAAYVVLVAIIFIDMATPFGGNIRFYSEWMRCGSRPLQEHGLPGGGVVFYVKSPIIGIFRGDTTKYYCTPLQAEQDGLSASQDQYEFPHREQYERDNPTKEP